MGKMFLPPTAKELISTFNEDEKINFKINELQSEIGKMNKQIAQLRKTKIKLWEQK